MQIHPKLSELLSLKIDDVDYKVDQILIEKLKKTSNVFKTNRVVKGNLNKKFYF